jgi:hypothetical protein
MKNSILVIARAIASFFVAIASAVAAFSLKKRVALTGLLVGVSTLSIAGVAGATGTTLEDSFTTTQASILQEMAEGAALLIAVMLFVIGITVLVKWSRKGSKMTA